MPLTHIVPNNDVQDHQVTKTGECWCKPQEQRETETDATYIHKPKRPLVPGHRLDLKKVWLDAATGDVLTDEIPR